jgi:hypothetical protein
VAIRTCFPPLKWPDFARAAQLETTQGPARELAELTALIARFAEDVMAGRALPVRMIRQVVEVRATEATIEVFHRGTRVASHARSGVKRRHIMRNERLRRSA